MVRDFNKFNNKVITLSNIEKIDEKRVSFSASVGRARYGFQEAVYDLADQCGVYVNIRKFGGFLEVNYRITVEGNDSNVDTFLRYLRQLN